MGTTVRHGYIVGVMPSGSLELAHWLVNLDKIVSFQSMREPISRQQLGSDKERYPMSYSGLCVITCRCTLLYTHMHIPHTCISHTHTLKKNIDMKNAKNLKIDYYLPDLGRKSVNLMLSGYRISLCGAEDILEVDNHENCTVS